MSTYAPPPYTLTDAEIAAVISAQTVAGVYDPNSHLTDAGIAAAVSSATVGGKLAGINAGDIGCTAMLRFTSQVSTTVGATTAGSALQWTPANGTGPGVVGYGTWMALGITTANADPAYLTTNFMRVA